MPTHSSILAWRSHGEGSLGGYSPWGRKVGRDWNNLACITSISSHMQPLASKYLLAFNILPSPSFKIYAPFKALLHATTSLESFLLWRFPIGHVFCHLWPSLYISSEDLLWRRALVYFLEQSYALWSLSSMEDLLGWVPCRIHFNKHNAKIWNQTPGSALPHPPNLVCLSFWWREPGVLWRTRQEMSGKGRLEAIATLQPTRRTPEAKEMASPGSLSM